MVNTTKSKLSESIAGIFILLFTYTALNKLFSFQQFNNVLSKSPLLKQNATFLAIAIPVLEIIIALLLFIPKWRATGFLASLLLMILFTAYIGYMLLTSAHLPCPCGGVLKQLGWKQHLLFNAFFILLALSAILLDQIPYPFKAKEADGYLK